jgi:hypothetical protein
MTTSLVRTWESRLNHVIADGGTADLTEMYGNAFLELHTMLKLAGWTVQASCGKAGGGALVADLNDNIGLVADVVPATAPTPHTWAIYEMPAGWIAGGTFQLGLDTRAGGKIHVWLSGNQPFNLGAPVTTAIPTSPTGHRNTFTGTDGFLPDTVLVNAKCHSGYNDAGDFWFCSSKDAGASVQAGMYFFTPDRTLTPANGGPDHTDWAFMYYHHFYTFVPGVFAWPAHGDSNQTRGAHFDGSAFYAWKFYSSSAEVSNWVGGISAGSSKVHSAAMDHWIDVNTVGAGRWLGKAVDVRTVAAGAPINGVDNAEAGDTFRYISFSGLFLPVRATQLPLQL